MLWIDCVRYVLQSGILHVMSVGGQYSRYTWSFGVDASDVTSEQNLAQVAVVDGGKFETLLNMTKADDVITLQLSCVFTCSKSSHHSIQNNHGSSSNVRLLSSHASPHQ